MMQYLLTEEEYRALTATQHRNKLENTEKLQAFCTLAAQHIPVAREWATDKTPAPWGCILGPRQQNPSYCDDCPVSEICPYQGKEWSK